MFQFGESNREVAGESTRVPRRALERVRPRWERGIAIGIGIGRFLCERRWLGEMCG